MSLLFEIFSTWLPNDGVQRASPYGGFARY